MIVDDEEDMRVLLRTTIQIANRGLSVDGEAASGEEAVTIWRAEQPEIVVLDQRMPGASGLETAQRILAENPDQAIILFSAYLDEPTKEAAARLGVVPQEDTLDMELTVRENLLIYGRYFDLPRAVVRERADRLLEFVQLDHRADERTGIRCAESIADLRDEIFVGLAVHVSAKAHSFIRRAKVESVNVTRKIAIRIR